MGRPFTRLKNPGDDYLYFNWVDVATALLRLKGVHEGWWRVGLQFDAHGAAVNIPISKRQHQKVPAVFLSVVNINLKPVQEQEIDELCVDAAVVNPQPRVLMPGSAGWPAN